VSLSCTCVFFSHYIHIHIHLIQRYLFTLFIYVSMYAFYVYSGMVKMVGTGLAGWFLGGKIHSRRATKKAAKKHMDELRDLYTKYIKDVTTMQSQIAELESFIKESARQQLADEFLRADYDNNRQVSRAEFEKYKREYLIKHPEMAAQFPEFEAFDPDRNGMITLREHEKYYEDRGMI
jgi:hypothetical protein